MAVLEIQGNGESSYVPQEAISSAIQLLEDPLQRVRIFWITPSTDFEMSLGFSSFLLGICSLLRARKQKAERTGKSSEYLNISLGGIYLVFCIHTQVGGKGCVLI